MNVPTADASIFVAGHTGMVGSAIVRRLRTVGFAGLVLRTHDQTDLTCQRAVDDLFISERPSHVFLAAARVGGIRANSVHPAAFIRDNLAIQTNVIHAAWRHGVGKLIFLGSSCIYPRDAPQPIREEALLTGPLEPTNSAYAVAKIAGVEMCRHYREEYAFDAVSLMPTNLYGPGDNYHPDDSHVVPALVRRFVEAAESGLDEVKIWGTGRPLREFLHVDDLARAATCVMRLESTPALMNVGSGDEVSILDLAHMIAHEANFRGRVATDASKPDGTPRKRLDDSRLRALGWSPRISLRDGLRDVVEGYRSRREGFRR